MVIRMAIFLTGGSSGIGAALAPRLADEGDRAIALVGRNEEALDRVAGKVREAGGTALPLVCDVRDRQAVAAAVRLCEEKLGPVDTLIASAGINSPLAGREFDAEAVEQVMRTNYLGTAYCIEAVLPQMVQARRGRIVGIASLAGFHGLPGSGAYCASKAAQISLLESLRIELRKLGIIVTVISPGFVRTPLTAGNRNPMPFLMDVDRAAGIIHHAIKAGARHKTFPWPLAALVRIGRVLPEALYDRSFSLSGLSAGTGREEQRDRKE
jgi:NAD(P)-dependent dehydrogenase (short-subunit alcohol dehydrogenase family)